MSDCDDSDFAMVKISLGQLPATFRLVCISSQALQSRLESIPYTGRALEATGANPSLRVGRAVQHLAFWSSLVPDEAIRHTISREHFELTTGAGGLRLKNLSPAGTMVNGEWVHEERRLTTGDTVGIGMLLPERHAALIFRVYAANQEDGAMTSPYTPLQAASAAPTRTTFESHDSPIELSPAYVAAVDAQNRSDAPTVPGWRYPSSDQLIGFKANDHNRDSSKARGSGNIHSPGAFSNLTSPTVEVSSSASPGAFSAASSDRVWAVPRPVPGRRRQL